MEDFEIVSSQSIFSLEKFWCKTWIQFWRWSEDTAKILTDVWWQRKKNAWIGNNSRKFLIKIKNLEDKKSDYVPKKAELVIEHVCDADFEPDESLSKRISIIREQSTTVFELTQGRIKLSRMFLLGVCQWLKWMLTTVLNKKSDFDHSFRFSNQCVSSGFRCFSCSF